MPAHSGDFEYRGIVMRELDVNEYSTVNGGLVVPAAKCVLIGVPSGLGTYIATTSMTNSKPNACGVIISSVAGCTTAITSAPSVAFAGALATAMCHTSSSIPNNSGDGRGSAGDGTVPGDALAGA